MKFLSKAHVLLLVSIFTVLILGAGAIAKKSALAFHLPELFLFSPTTPGTDDVAGKTDASYDVYYSPLYQNTLTTLTVSFPSGYIITDGVLDPSTAITSSSQGTCVNSPGFMCVSGDDTTYTVTGMTGDSVARTITITIDPVTVVGFHNVDFQFSILQGVQNPTTAGVYPASTFDVSNDADNSGTLAKVGPDVTIIAGPADHLIFSQEPAGPTSGSDSYTSGATFTTQPIIEAVDQYDNVDTTYNETGIDLYLATGAGLLTTNSGPNFGCYAGGHPAPNPMFGEDILVDAVNGVIDYSPKMVAYYAATDHESFTLGVQANCNGTGITGAVLGTTFTSDVIATDLSWETDPSGCVSGAACTTQGTVIAQSYNGFSFTTPSGEALDTDYSGSITFGSTGAGTIVGTSPQSMTGGTLTTVGLGYTNTDPTADETIKFTADSGSLDQGLTQNIVVGAAGSTPPPPSPTPTPTPTPTPESIGAGHNPNLAEVPNHGQLAETTVATCAPYLSTFLRPGAIGDAVTKLQEFLRTQSFFTYPTSTGFFGSFTFQAVKDFQQKYSTDILIPQQLQAPTGLVLDYTLAKINAINCGR